MKGQSVDNVLAQLLNIQREMSFHFSSPVFGSVIVLLLTGISSSFAEASECPRSIHPVSKIIENPKGRASGGTLFQIQKIYGQSAAIQKQLELSDFQNLRGAARVVHVEKDRLTLQTADAGDVLVIENDSAPIYQDTIRLSEVYTNPHEVFTLKAFVAENGPDGKAITRESGTFKHEGLAIETGAVLSEYNRFQSDLDKDGTIENVTRKLFNL